MSVSDDEDTEVATIDTVDPEPEVVIDVIDPVVIDGGSNSTNSTGGGNVTTNATTSGNATAPAAEPIEYTIDNALGDFSDNENNVNSLEEQCQIAQEFYWALLVLLDQDNNGELTVEEFEDAADALTGEV